MLNHLQFGVFENLEKLWASFDDTSVETARKMKRIAPNLKKIHVHSICSSTTINALLESLENLEWLIFCSDSWEMAENTTLVCAKLKHIFASCSHSFKISAASSRKFSRTWNACTLICLKSQSHLLSRC